MSRPSKTTLARGQLVQAHEAAPERRLAAAGLAHEAERLAGTHLERDVVDGLHARDLAADHAAALDREVLRDRLAPGAAARRSRRQLRVDRRLAPRELLGHRQEAAVEVTGRRALLERRPLGAGARRRAGSAARRSSPAGARAARAAVPGSPSAGAAWAGRCAGSSPAAPRCTGAARSRTARASGRPRRRGPRTSRRRGRRCRRRLPCRA